MGYEKAAGSNPSVYFANGMDNTREDAWATAGKLGVLLGRDVGLVVNGTAGIGGDVKEYLPNSYGVKEVLNEYTYRKLNSEGATLVIGHSAGNNDFLQAMKLGSEQGYSYDNLSYLSVGSPISSGKLAKQLGVSGVEYMGQVNDWRDPVTYSKSAATVGVGSAVTGVVAGAVTGVVQGATFGGSAGAGTGPLGALFGGVVGGVVGGAVGGAVGVLPAVGGYLGIDRFHGMQENYLKKEELKEKLEPWIKK